MTTPIYIITAVMLLSASVRAETLFDGNFASQSPGELKLGQTIKDNDGVAEFWQGPQPGENGHFAIVDAPEATGSIPGKSVLAIYDNNPENNKAPAFTIQLSKAPDQTKALVVETKLLIPVSGPYQGLIGFGKGSWDAAAAVFTLTGGKLSAWQPGDTYTAVGSYAPNTWIILRVTFDAAKKTYDVQVNDQKAASALPWVHTKNASLTYFEFLADMAPKDRGGEPVLYIEYVKITTE